MFRLKMSDKIDMKTLSISIIFLFSFTIFAQQKLLLDCQDLPIEGHPRLQVFSERLNGVPYIISYVVNKDGKRKAVESYPDKKGERFKGLKKPSFHVFPDPKNDYEWQLVNYKNAFLAAGDSWNLVRVGGPKLSKEELEKYPKANDPSMDKINKSAFYDMKCKEPPKNSQGIIEYHHDKEVHDGSRKSDDSIEADSVEDSVGSGSYLK